ncbi:hypothetical protein PCE1_002246 [Barthelona sp. PCE]
MAALEVLGKVPPHIRKLLQEPRNLRLYNHRIQLLYNNHEFTECQRLIDTVLKENPLSSFARHIQALIYRHQGKVNDSVELFASVVENSGNYDSKYHYARSLYLQGRLDDALEMLKECMRERDNDAQVMHYAGVCSVRLSNNSDAIEFFKRSIKLSHHPDSYIQLGRLYAELDDSDMALRMFNEAIDYFPHNIKVLTALGIHFLRKGHRQNAFNHLGAALTFDPFDGSALLAAGAVLQDSGDVEVALTKYRILAKSHAHLQFWNNVGVCFFLKRDYVSAVACLQRALEMSPFDWIISFNLACAYLMTRQYFSAFLNISRSINLNRKYAASFKFLALALTKLEDHVNAEQAYIRAIKLAGNTPDHVTLLNYAIFQYNRENFTGAKDTFLQFQRVYDTLPPDEKNIAEVAANNRIMKSALNL